MELEIGPRIQPERMKAVGPGMKRPRRSKNAPTEPAAKPPTDIGTRAAPEASVQAFTRPETDEEVIVAQPVWGTERRRNNTDTLQIPDTIDRPLRDEISGDSKVQSPLLETCCYG